MDAQRVLTRGGSAGGYPTLVLAAMTDVCRAGASYCRISDLVTLIKRTHKRETRCPIALVGAYPEQKQLYQERAPISWLDRLETPLILP